MTEGRTQARLKVLAGLVVFMFAALTTRLWFMQVLASEQYKQQATSNGIRLIYEPAPRGQIVDRAGKLLVGNRMSLVVTVNRQQLGDSEEAVLFRLSKLLDLPVKTLVQRLHDPRYYVYTPVPVATDVSKDVAFYIGEHEDQFPGVQTQVLPVRTYPGGNLAAHLLGYIGQITADELKDPRFHGYTQGDLVGQSGVEASYEQYLQGTKGLVKYQVNASGKNLGEIGSRPPVPGDDVVLSIDTRVQRLAEQALAAGEKLGRTVYDPSTHRDLQANAGAVVVMNPRNGQILALASSPTYDPRLFIGGVSNAVWQQLNGAAGSHPLLDRAIQAEYPPGSTFKPFVALSALRHGYAHANGFYPCPPSYTAPGDTSGTVFHNWTTANLGTLSLSSALVQSCDTVFYPFGWDFWVNYFHHGTLPFQRDMRSFGFGRPSGVDLPAEHGGRIPDPTWKQRIHKLYPHAFPYGQWLPGDFINMMIGQGDALVTPLQLATAYSAIANGGTVWQPHVGLAIRDPEGKLVQRIAPRVNGHLPMSKSFLAFVRNALSGVPVRGTAAFAFRGFPFWKVPVAGKTGTAQVNPHQDDSWFAAMAPANNPQYVVVAMVEQGGHGATTAAPVVRRILEGLFGLQPSGLISGGLQD